MIALHVRIHAAKNVFSLPSDCLPSTDFCSYAPSWPLISPDVICVWWGCQHKGCLSHLALPFCLTCALFLHFDRPQEIRKPMCSQWFLVLKSENKQIQTSTKYLKTYLKTYKAYLAQRWCAFNLRTWQAWADDRSKMQQNFQNIIIINFVTIY